MIKLLIIGRRRAGVTRAQASRHLRFVHGPMVYDAPADAGAMPAHYVQNHVFDGVHLADAAGALTPYGIDRDLVTEVWFADLDAMIQSTRTPYYLANLKPDEPRFVDDATVVRCMLAEGAREGGAPNGRFKLFVFLKVPQGGDLGAASVAWREALAPALQAAGAGWIENLVRGRPGEPTFADRVWEAWFDDLAGLTRFVDVDLATALAALADSFDPAATLYMLAEEYTVERLRAGD